MLNCSCQTTYENLSAILLSTLCREVHTVERIPELGKLAAARLKRLGYSNVHVHLANGTLGLPIEAPAPSIFPATIH